MFEKELTRTDRLLISLLKAALNQTAPTDGPAWDAVTEKEWDKCLTLASHHGVVAVAWDGIGYLPGGHDRLRDVKFSWALSVERCEEIYEDQCRTANQLEDLYRKNGIAMVQMKGVGFSTYYPVPSHRQGGDVDIYTWSADKDRMTDKEANLLADEIVQRKGVKVDTVHSPKHSNFQIGDVPVENHRTLLNVYNGGIAIPMNALLLRLLKPETALLCNGKYKVSIPNVPFNALFIGFHAAQHFGCGFCLHHLFDWACLLKRHGWCIPDEVKDKRLLNFFRAMTHLCNTFFGTDVPVQADEKLARKVVKEMMHPLFPHKSKIKAKKKWPILKEKTRRFLYHHHTQQTVFDISLPRQIFLWILSWFRNPRSIFKIR